MRILQVYHIFPALFGGASTVVYQITKDLSGKGHKVDVLTTNVRLRHGENRNLDGVSVYRFPVVSEKLANYNIVIPVVNFLLWVKDRIETYDCIHIHGHKNPYSIIVHHYAVKYDVPYVLQAHGSLPRIGSWRRLKWFYDVLFGYRLLRDAAKVIALSRVEAEQYKRMGVSEEKIAIIPNGIDLSEYADLPSRGEFKKKFNIPEDKKIILYLGRIHRTKGIDYLVKAYAYLKRKMNCNDTILVIAGPDDGYLNEVKSLIHDLGISNSVLFTGPLYGKDKISAYVDSEVYVLPSRYETFPMTVLEAYACGKPVITSKIGGLKDLVMNGETGLLFEPGNVEQLARNILYLLNDNGEAKEMGLKGKEFVKENLTIESAVTKLEKVYEEIVEVR